MMLFDSLILPASAGPPASTPVFSSTTLSSQTSTSNLGLGFKFILSQSITVTNLARWIISGNIGTHTLGIYTNPSTPIVTAILDTAGATPGQWNYVSCTPTVLSSGTVYYCTSNESGTFYYNPSTVVFGSILSSVVAAKTFGSSFITSTANASYGPLNFQYHL